MYSQFMMHSQENITLGLNVIPMKVAVVWLSQNYTAITTTLNIKCNKSKFLYCGTLFRISGLQ